MIRRVFGGRQARESSASLEDLRFSVVDVETTGLFPQAWDRVIEIAIVTVDSKGNTFDEFVTLVNPQRDIGPTHIHGLTAADIINAPSFDAIAGDVASRLCDNVFVAHNARFDLGFIEAEFGRMGYLLPPLPSLCTMKLARKLITPAPSFSLASLCEYLSISGGRAHSALEDARSTVRLLAILVAEAQTGRINNDIILESSAPQTTGKSWPKLDPSGRTLTRERAAVRIVPSYLSQLAERLPTRSLTTEETVEYVDLLNRVLEDRRVSADEADLLLQVATQWGLTSERVKTVHEEYLYALVTAALRDGVVTEAERRDLNGVAQLFEHGADDVEALITSAGRAVSTNKASHPFGVKSLSSLSVCFTGESQCLCEGLPLSREQAERLAAEAGLIIRKSVTRGLDILVAADPDSLSGKARRAREYGIRIMAEAVFWQSIGVDMG